MSNDIGAITDAELARNGIVQGRAYLLLNIHGDIHSLPTNWGSMTSAEILRYTMLHSDVHRAIMNDGKNPLQLKFLEENKHSYELARKKALEEEELWTGMRTLPADSRLYAPPWG